MGIEELEPFIGRWEMSVDIPGADGMRGSVTFEWLSGGPVLVQRSEVPDSGAPDAICLVVSDPSGGYLQHYFDSRGVVRLYAMTFRDGLWTLSRTAPDFSPLDFHQRYTGRFVDDDNTVDGAWESSEDGTTWHRDFGLVYRRIT